MNQNDYRRLWLKLHRSYEKKAFSIFRKGLKDAAKKIPFDNLDKYNYIPSIEFNVSQEDVFKAYYKAYYQIGMLYGNRITRGIVRDTKGLELDVFQQAFKNELLQWLTHNAALRITTVRQSLINYLIDIIKSGITEGKTVKELAKEIEQLVNSRNFYRWQAMRIARTETTAAANYGASVASETSIYVLEKIWISSNDARTREIEKGDRYDHVDMDKITVGEKELFDVQGDLIRFPGDPKGQAANIINCRCTVALQPKRDSNGRLIRKGTEFASNYNNPSIDSLIKPKPIPVANNTGHYPLNETMDELEKRIRLHKYEIGGIFDRKTGKALVIRDGNKNISKGQFVKFSNEEMLLSKGNILTHNHPGGGAFSDADLHYLFYTRTHEIRALAPDRNYRMINKSVGNIEFSTREFKSFKASIGRVYNRVRREESKKYHEGHYKSVNDFVTGFSERVWKEWTTGNNKYGKYFDFIIEKI